MPNLSNLWQRFLLASSLLVGLAIGVAATVFGYSNLTTVNVHWSVLHVDGVPLWTVAVVPVALTLVAGTLYHWMNSFHHFTEHMRHRRRVHELEAEVASIRGHLDHVLQMPDHLGLPAKEAARVSPPVNEEHAAEPPPVEAPSPEAKAEAPKPRAERRKRVRLTVASKPEAAQANGEDSATAAETAPAKPDTGA